VYLPFVADTARRKRDEMDENTPYTPEDEDLDDIEAEFDAIEDAGWKLLHNWGRNTFHKTPR
jgi:hypothetical protein